MAKLCEAYWYPLYAYVRSRGRDVEDAQDLTQGFFTKILETNAVDRADSARGRFRAFLLASLKNYLTNEWHKARALRRGGGRAPISLDMDAAEEKFRLEPSHTETPEKLYERRWILTLIDRVLAEMRAELSGSRDFPLFDRFKDFLHPEGDPGPYSEAASQLNMTEGALKMKVSRQRQRFRALVRAEIAQTVSNADDVDDEIRHLFSLFES